LAHEKTQFPSGRSLPRVGFCYSRAVDRSRAWKFAILGRWTLPARRNPRFLSGGTPPREGSRVSWAHDGFRARKYAILGICTSPARSSPRSLSCGALPLSVFSLYGALAISCARKFAIPERWIATARGILLFLGGGPFPRVRTRYSWAMDHSRA